MPSLLFPPSVFFFFSPREGNGTPLQYSCLENPMDSGAWKAEVCGVTKSLTQLSDFIFTFHFHALEKEMSAHSSVLAWRIPGMAAIYGVAQSWTRLKRLSSSSSFPYWASPHSAVIKKQESACLCWGCRDLGLIPGFGRSPGGGGHGNPLWYLGLENSMDRGA